MSFYVTLPSNTSKEMYPNNTLTCYTTKLKNPIKLEGSYEVALVEMMYPVNWKYRDDASIIVSDNLGNILKYNIQFHCYDTVNDIINGINDFFSSNVIEINMLYVNQKVRIGAPANTVVEFTNDAQKNFGFKDMKKLVFNNQNIIIAETSVKLFPNTIASLFVYTDIVEFQYVGDENAPIIREVATNTNVTFVDKIYDSPHYVPVIRNNIDTILIDIRSDLGEHIQFGEGVVVVKLHFRKKSYYLQ